MLGRVEQIDRDNSLSLIFYLPHRRHAVLDQGSPAAYAT
jgi:hypothetical protein